MPRSFWHAFSKSLVAVSISSPVTWHNVSWAIDLAMRCSAACSISDMSVGAGCVNWTAVAPCKSNSSVANRGGCGRSFFFDRRPVPFGGSRHLRLTRLPRHDRGPVPGGNRSAASCLCTVLRRALYHYATRSPEIGAKQYDTEGNVTKSRRAKMGLSST